MSKRNKGGSNGANGNTSGAAFLGGVTLNSGPPGSGASSQGGSSRSVKTNPRRNADQQKNGQAQRRTNNLNGPNRTGGSAQPMSLQQRYDRLLALREQERAQGIRDGTIRDPTKPATLENAVSLIGTCPDMCPEFERVERIMQNDVWKSEKIPHNSPDGDAQETPFEARMVKKYRRAAAGNAEQLPSDLRPPAVLKKTVEFLLEDAIDKAPNLKSIHYFLWDRTRAVRNDFSIQQVTQPADVRIAIECFEKIVRFHILSTHQLAAPEPSDENYDPFQDREQLHRSILSLSQYYDDNRDRYQSPNEPEFRAYSILLNISSPSSDLHDTIQTWPAPVVSSPQVQRAVRIYNAATSTLERQGPGQFRIAHLIAQENWKRFWALVESHETSYLMACVAEMHFNLVRRMTLHNIWRAYKVGGNRVVKDWSIKSLVVALGLDSQEQVEDMCEYYDMSIGTNDDNSTFLDFSTLGAGPFPLQNGEMRQLKSFRIVEAKRYRRTFGAIVQGMPVMTARRMQKTIPMERPITLIPSNELPFGDPSNPFPSSNIYDTDNLFVTDSADEDDDDVIRIPHATANTAPAPTSAVPVPQSNSNPQTPQATEPLAAPGAAAIPSFSSFPSATAQETGLLSAPKPNGVASPALSSKSGPMAGGALAGFMTEKQAEVAPTASKEAPPGGFFSTAPKDAGSFFSSLNKAPSSTPSVTSKMDISKASSVVSGSAMSTSGLTTPASESTPTKRIAFDLTSTPPGNPPGIKFPGTSNGTQAGPSFMSSVLGNRPARPSPLNQELDPEAVKKAEEARQRARLLEFELAVQHRHEEERKRQAELERARLEEEAKQRRERYLQRVARDIFLAPSTGLWSQYVEFVAGPMVKSMIKEHEEEQQRKRADEFRVEKLSLRYGYRWLDIVTSRKTLRRALRRRRNLMLARTKGIDRFAKLGQGAGDWEHEGESNPNSASYAPGTNRAAELDSLFRTSLNGAPPKEGPSNPKPSIPRNRTRTDYFRLEMIGIDPVLSSSSTAAAAAADPGARGRKRDWYEAMRTTKPRQQHVRDGSVDSLELALHGHGGAPNVLFGRSPEPARPSAAPFGSVSPERGRRRRADQHGNDDDDDGDDRSATADAADLFGQRPRTASKRPRPVEVDELLFSRLRNVGKALDDSVAFYRDEMRKMTAEPPLPGGGAAAAAADPLASSVFSFGSPATPAAAATTGRNGSAAPPPDPTANMRPMAPPSLPSFIDSARPSFPAFSTSAASFSSSAAAVAGSFGRAGSSQPLYQQQQQQQPAAPTAPARVGFSSSAGATTVPAAAAAAAEAASLRDKIATYRARLRALRDPVVMPAAREPDVSGLRQSRFLPGRLVGRSRGSSAGAAMFGRGAGGTPM